MKSTNRIRHRNLSPEQVLHGELSSFHRLAASRQEILSSLPVKSTGICISLCQQRTENAKTSKSQLGEFLQLMKEILASDMLIISLNIVSELSKCDKLIYREKHHLEMYNISVTILVLTLFVFSFQIIFQWYDFYCTLKYVFA